MINFKLKKFEEIVPIGQKPNLSLSWFWLTDADLYLTIGNNKIYEYSTEALSHFGHKKTPYNDYYLARFIEDFTKLFQKIGESIPEKYYELSKNKDLFEENAQKWLDKYDTDEDEHNDFYFDEYNTLISWIYERNLNSGHLIGGPSLWFFRCKNKINIVWETDDELDNGGKIWTAKSGNHEMNYDDFVSEINTFGIKFFSEMDERIRLTIEKKWENIEINKNRLLEEHKERKQDFETDYNLLIHEQKVHTNWFQIENLFIRMINEIS
jgi:hypothetical protein